jgi:hypothetical protein
MDNTQQIITAILREIAELDRVWHSLSVEQFPKYAGQKKALVSLLEKIEREFSVTDMKDKILAGLNQVLSENGEAIVKELSRGQ